MSTVTATASDAVLISPTQLLALQAAEPVVLIDTRDADTYALGHIPGAVNLRETFTYLATSTPQGLQELKDTFAAHLGAIGLSGAETAVFYEDALNSGYGQSCRGYYSVGLFELEISVRVEPVQTLRSASTGSA